MRKPRISVPVRIGSFFLIGLAALLAGGIFTYHRMTEVIDSFHERNDTDTGLPEIRYLTTSMEQAENNIRLYGITRRYSYLREYRQLIAGIDTSINHLYVHYPEDDWFTAKIDTIHLLFMQKKELWNNMGSIWLRGATSREISELSEELRSNLPEEDTTEKFLARIFSEKEEESTSNDSLLLQRLDALEEGERQFESSLSRQEVQLALSSIRLSEAFLSLTAQLNDYQTERENEKIQKADKLAGRAYLLTGALSLIGVLLGFIGLLILGVYIRKNSAYNEVLLQSKSDAEELARSKEQFIANVSHEIRTPLNAMIGFIRQLLSSDIDIRVRERLKIVDSAGDQLLRLINDVLDFSKLQAGSLVLDNTHFRVKEVIAGAGAIFSEAARANGNMIETDTSGILHPVLFGDTHRFRQILYNLISNAVKFTENGRIEIQASTEQERDQILLTLIVKDTGMGIEESKLQKIFEEYSQADQDITVRYGGTGLGLSIVGKLVELFNGNIRVESRKGVGTEVTCILHFLQGDETKIQATEKELPSGIAFPDGIRVLVADDEPYNLALVNMILDKWNIAHDQAKTGLEAIELIRENSYDLVLMDLRMPVINGVMATRFIRDTLKLTPEELPVIGITAHTAPDRESNELAGLFNRVLVKPFSEAELYQVMSGNQVRKSGESADKETGHPFSGNKTEKAEERNADGSLSNLVRASGNDLKFVRTMIDQFASSTREGLLQIREALESGDSAPVREIAHKLAAPARHLQVNGLYRILKELEEESGNSEAEVLQALIEQAEQLLEGAVKNLDRQFEAIER